MAINEDQIFYRSSAVFFGIGLSGLPPLVCRSTRWSSLAERPARPPFSRLLPPSARSTSRSRQAAAATWAGLARINGALRSQVEQAPGAPDERGRGESRSVRSGRGVVLLAARTGVNHPKHARASPRADERPSRQPPTSLTSWRSSRPSVS